MDLIANNKMERLILNTLKDTTLPRVGNGYISFEVLCFHIAAIPSTSFNKLHGRIAISLQNLLARKKIKHLTVGTESHYYRIIGNEVSIHEED